jgi:hypothetical protein
MITKQQLESIGFHYDPKLQAFLKHAVQYGLLIKPDGTATIDNVGSYDRYRYIHEGINTIEDLMRKLTALGIST